MSLIDDLRVDIGDDSGAIPSGVPSHNLLSASHGDTTVGSPSLGALVAGTATRWVALPAGFEGAVLMISSGAAVWGSGAPGPIGPIGPSGVQTLAETLDLGNIANQQVVWLSGLGDIQHLLGPSDDIFKVASASGQNLELYAGGVLRAIISPTGTQLINSVDINVARDGGGDGTLRAGIVYATSGVFSESVTGAAGGDLEGALPNPVVVAISGKTVNHAGITDGQVLVYNGGQFVASGIPTHTRYTDAEASGVAVQVVSTGISTHAAITDAHHVRYTDAEAEAHIGGVSGVGIGDLVALENVGGNVGINLVGSGSILSVAHIQFNAAPEVPAHTEGMAYWNEDDNTLNLMTDVDGTVIQVGQELVFKATNKTDSTISNGQVVYINGAQGNRPTIQLARADTHAGTDRVIGLTTSSISNNQNGYVATAGLVRDVDTSSFSEGERLWLSPTTSGALVNSEPLTPYHSVAMGFCIVSHATQGLVQLHVQNGDELGDLHNVLITSPLQDDLISYNAASGYWENSPRYTDIDASGVAVIVATTGISNHAAIAEAHHTRYTDAEASGVAAVVATTGISSHAAITDAHHSRYTNAEAEAHIGGVSGITIGDLVALENVGGLPGLPSVDGSQLTNLSVSSTGVLFPETTTPVAVSGFGQMYTKVNKNLYFQDGAGDEHIIHGFPTFKSETVNTQGLGGSADVYAFGSYEFSTTDANLNQGATTATFGGANVTHAAHAFIVAGGVGTVDTGVVGLRVTGTSITDGGVRTPGDSETIVTDITDAGQVALNTYIEGKKWLGTITFELFTVSGSPTTYSFDFNYGLSAYDDMANNDFAIDSILAEGLGGATDTEVDVQLIHHRFSGWLYAATGFSAVQPVNIIASLVGDHTATENEVLNSTHFRWKRTQLNANIAGGDSEGILVLVSTSANNAIEYCNIHIGLSF